MKAIADTWPQLQFYSDPGLFLAAAGDYLAASPVITTVVATMVNRLMSQHADGGTTKPQAGWWLVVRDQSGAIAGAGMRTAPSYPLFVLPMPETAARALAHNLHERGEEVLAANGALPAVELFAAETAALSGGQVEVSRHTRLHELGRLVLPPPVPGHLRAVTRGELDLARDWFSAFMGDADEQAGHTRGSGMHEVPDDAEMLRRIDAGQLWFWVDKSGLPVHLTGANPPSFGVARIGPVYTPPDQRGHGWASNAVAELSRRNQDLGARVCLYTDQANPTSNKIYAALGYEPVVDMANLGIVH